MNGRHLNSESTSTSLIYCIFSSYASVECNQCHHTHLRETGINFTTETIWQVNLNWENNFFLKKKNLTVEIESTSR